MQVTRSAKHVWLMQVPLSACHFARAASNQTHLEHRNFVAETFNAEVGVAAACNDFFSHKNAASAWDGCAVGRSLHLSISICQHTSVYVSQEGGVPNRSVLC